MTIIAHPIRRCTPNQQQIIRAIAAEGYVRESYLPASTVRTRTLNTLRNHGLIEREWLPQCSEYLWHLTPECQQQIAEGSLPR